LYVTTSLPQRAQLFKEFCAVHEIEDLDRHDCRYRFAVLSYDSRL
jgi:hypothetical protein